MVTMFQVNITVMMVLTSVYLSVSASLPSTPAIKPVEVWLLASLSYPFFIIMAAIADQVNSRPEAVFIIPLSHSFCQTLSDSEKMVRTDTRISPMEFRKTKSRRQYLKSFTEMLLTFLIPLSYAIFYVTYFMYYFISV